jgi:hypothetical protein
VKLLVDMNLSPRWIETPGLAGVGAAHWSKLGPASAPDHVIFRHAAEHDFIAGAANDGSTTTFARTSSARAELALATKRDRLLFNVSLMFSLAIAPFRLTLALTADPGSPRTRL